MELGRVFVSSVFGGMLNRRKLAAEAVLRAGLSPVLTEEQVAQSASVRSLLSREIEHCDTYVGLFDQRRGTVPPGSDTARAITEEEFHLARELGLRCLVFLSDADHREPELKEFLERDVSDYATGVWTRYYGSDDALAREITAALSAVRPRIVAALSGSTMTLYLSGVQPAWKGEAVLGPVEVDLKPSATVASLFKSFLWDAASRNRLREEELRFAGAELASHAFPGDLGAALESLLDQAAHAGRLLTLEIRTGDSDALALPWELLSFAKHPLPVRQGLVEVVRRIPPATDSDPTRDPAPEVPPDRIAVLGFTAAPLDDQIEQARPGTGGIRDSDLFWEREQERLLIALDDLVRTGRGRLILPDTGDKEELRKQLGLKDRPQIVHLSCHGGVEQGSSPVLYLEDAEGRRCPVGAEELLSWTRANPEARRLDLLVLSACDSADAAGLAASLVRNGLPRVLGMQSTVTDHGATAFAGAFYEAVARGADLATALRAGRAELLAKGLPHEWAIPTLTLSRDAGPLVAPLAGDAPLKTPFELAREDFDIAGVAYLERGYIGRRDVDRALARAFENQSVLVIHGLGGIGKSTLVSRFLERRKEEGARLLVFFAGRELAPAPFLEEVARKLGVERPSGLPPDEADRQFAAELREALRKIRPTVLLLDNFEDNQDIDGNLKNPALGEALAELVHLGGPGFRLMITSRLPIELPALASGVWNCDLGELSPSGCRKYRLLHPESLGKLDEEIWRKVLHHLGGHPKALELLGSYIEQGSDHVHTLIESFEEASKAVDVRLAAKVQERGRRLLVDAVLAQVPEERLPAFDRLCLLEEPLPFEELKSLLAGDGIVHPAADLVWLRGHGLLARRVSPTAVTGGDAVHRLLASRREKALAEREGDEAARLWHGKVADHFEQRKGPLSDFGFAARHRDLAGDRAGALALYGRWALSLRNRHAYVACIQIIQEGLQRFPPGGTEAEKVAAASLWNTIHDSLIPIGAISDAEKALQNALSWLEGCSSAEARFERARSRLSSGQLLVQLGRIPEAQTEFEAAETELREGGYERDRAVTLGEIARLRAQSGDVAGALKLHEEELRTYEQLGDVRSRAVTLGEIARLRAQSGDVAGALKLHEERLGIFEQLGAVRDRAVTLGEIARLRAQAGDVAGALKLHEEELRTYEQLGAVRDRAVTLGDIARLRAQAGDVAEARRLQEERLAGMRGLGDVEGIGAAQTDLAMLDFQEKKFGDAKERLAEAWEIFNRIGRVDFLMNAGYLYGMLLGATNREAAIPVVQRAREAAVILDSTEGLQAIEGLLASLQEEETPEDAASADS